MSNNVDSLSITLSAHNSYWISFLDSEGFEWRLFDNKFENSKVLILSSKPSDHIKDYAIKLLQSGGVIISDNRKLSFVKGIHRIKNLKKDTGFEEFDIHLGKFFILSTSIKRLAQSNKTVKKNITTGIIGGDNIVENLPEVQKKIVRSHVRKCLYRAFSFIRLPIVQKWYWPKDNRSFFTFRADMDAGNEESMRHFISNIRRYSDYISFCVCGKAYIDKRRLLREVINLNSEIANHTFTHYVFSSRKKNWENIELTEILLRKFGVSLRGYVGPASFWHSSMYDVLEKKGYEYTSSFGVDYDSYPYFPPKDDGYLYKMLEIPFHCIGDLFAKFGIRLESDDVMKFFSQLIEKKYLSCEPIFIYGHPDMPGRMGDNAKLVTRIFDKALSYSDIYMGNMIDVSDWWRQRQKTLTEIRFIKNKNLLIAENYKGSKDVYWSVQIEEDCKYIVSSHEIINGINLNEIAKKKKINLLKNPNTDLGEVCEPPNQEMTFGLKLKKWKQEIRRKRKMIKLLNSYNISSK